MSLFWRKQVIVISIIVMEIIHFSLFNQALIPGALLTIVGVLLALIYTLDRRYILKRLDEEICILFLFSVVFFEYSGIGIVAILTFLIWIGVNFFYYWDEKNKRKTLSENSDVIIKEILDKATAEGDKADYNHLEQEMKQRLQENYQSPISTMQIKHNQSESSDKPKYQEKIEDFNKAKEEKFDEGVDSLKALVKELQQNLSDANATIKQMQLKIATNDKLLSEKNQELDEQSSNLNHMRGEIERLNLEIVNSQGDKEKIEKLENEIITVRNDLNLLDQKYQQTLSDRDRIEKETILEKQEMQRLLDEEKEKNLKLQQEMALMKQSFEAEVQRIEAQKVEASQILTSKKIKNAFKQGLQSAKHEVCIISPWVKGHIIDNYESEFERLAKNKVKVKIIYGFGSNSQSKKHEEENRENLEESKNAIEKIKKIFNKRKSENLISADVRDSHAKLFIVDEEWYLLGSMNLLSFDYSNKTDHREELAEKIYNPEKIKEYKKLFFSFDKNS